MFNQKLFIWPCDILYDSTIDGASVEFIFMPFSKELPLSGVRVNNLAAYRQCRRSKWLLVGGSIISYPIPYHIACLSASG